MTSTFKIGRTGAGLALAAALCIGTGLPQPAQAQEYFIGQIFIGGFNFCPRGSTMANGALLPISQNQALFSLLGTTYGGDGRTSFGLPDLRGRSAVGQGTGPGLTPRNQGRTGGAPNVTLNANQLPSHSHGVNLTATGQMLGSSATASATTPAGNVPAVTGEAKYAPNIGAPMAANTVTATLDVTTGAAGSGASVGIQDPFLVLTYCIATQGIFPSRS
ncbi:MAG: tail fiber protein [Pseudomonadota bacterium]